MRFQVQRETLLRPLQQVIGVVERRQTLPVLGNILVYADTEGIRLTATDLEVELSAQAAVAVEEAGEITLPARKMLDICRALPEGADVTLSLDQDRALVRSGRSRFTLATQPAAEFPVVEDVKAAREFTLAQGELKRLIERTHFAMAQQDVRYYLNGLMLEVADGGALRAVATDGHRLSLCELPEAGAGEASQQVIVPRKGVQELLRLLEDSDAEATVQIGSNHLRVNMPEIRLTSKLVDGRFPDYQRVLPKTGEKRVVADREGLRQALARTSILSNEKYRGIRWMLDKNSIKIQSHNPEQEEAEEELEVEYKGKALEIGFNVTYLLDALAAIPDEAVEVHLTDANSSCLIQAPGNDQCKYVVMPMRL